MENRGPPSHPKDVTVYELTQTFPAAGIGSIVRVEDRFGRVLEYELVARDDEPPRQRVPADSAIGQALLGARPGDQVRITLENGRRRLVRVLDVTDA